MAARPPVFALFIGTSGSRSRRDGSPLVPLQPVPRPRVQRRAWPSPSTFFLGIASFALVLTLFLQLGLGFTPAARRADVPALLGRAC